MYINDGFKYHFEGVLSELFTHKGKIISSPCKTLDSQNPKTKDLNKGKYEVRLKFPDG